MRTLCSVLTGLVVFLAANAQATLVFWDRNGTAPGAGGPSPTGSWNSDAYNWNTNGDGTGATGPVPWGDGNFAVFAAGNDATGAYDVYVSNVVQVADIHVDLGTVTFLPDPVAGGTLKLVAWEGSFPNTFLDGNTNRLLSVGQKDPNATAIYSVVLSNAFGITRYKRGTLIFAATNQFTGPITNQGGIIKLGVPYAIPKVCQLILANNDPTRSDFNPAWQYTPAVLDTAGYSQTLDTLGLDGSDSSVLRMIDFERLPSALAFSDSSALDWGPFTLTITNFVLGADTLRFGTTGSGLTAQQLSQMDFVDFQSLPGQINAHGYVTPNLPNITSVVPSGSTANVTWTAVDGRAYRCQYKNALTDPNWTDISPDVAGGGGVASVTDPNASSSQRFYRVMVLPP